MENRSIEMALDMLVATIAEQHQELAAQLAHRLDSAAKGADADKALKQDLTRIAAQLREKA